MITNDLGYVMGAIMGDGYIYKKKDRKDTWYVYLNSIDKEFIDALEKALKRVTGHQPRTYLYSHKFRNQPAPYGHTYTYVSKGFKLVFCNSYWVKKIKKFIDTFYKGIISLPKNVERSFLRGFFDADGSSSSNSIRFFNKDKKLLDIIRELLENQGYHVFFYDYPNQTRKSIAIYRKAEQERFLREIGSSISHKGRKHI